MITVATRTKVLAILRSLKDMGSIKPNEECELASNIKKIPVKPNTTLIKEKSTAQA